MINNAIGINYHYSARSRERFDGLIHVMIHSITYLHFHKTMFMFMLRFYCFDKKKKTININIKDFINFGFYLNVVCRTWGEVCQQRLWYVQVLCHLREGGIWVRTHLLVPTGMEAILPIIAFHSALYIYQQGVTKNYKYAIKPDAITLNILVYLLH